MVFVLCGVMVFVDGWFTPKHVFVPVKPSLVSDTPVFVSDKPVLVVDKHLSHLRSFGSAREYIGFVGEVSGFARGANRFARDELSDTRTGFVRDDNEHVRAPRLLRAALSEARSADLLEGNSLSEATPCLS